MTTKLIGLVVLLVAHLGLLAPAVEAASTEICVQDGEEQGICFRRPRLRAEGIPSDAKWARGGGDPTAKDDDVVSDDDLGKAKSHVNGKYACVDIANDGGDLSGPNGEPQTGFGEGDCLEVYMEWTYHYTVTVEHCTTVGGGLEFGLPTKAGSGVTQISKQSCITWTEIASGKVTAGPKTVCSEC